MSKKIYILDNIFDGHHKVYMDTLEKIENVINISTQYKFELDKLNIYKYMKSRMQVVEYGLNQISNQDILHLLYIDPLYIISPIFRNKGKKIIGTLHHFPQNKAHLFVRLRQVFLQVQIRVRICKSAQPSVSFRFLLKPLSY